MAMTESESEAHLENITVETQNNLDVSPFEKDNSTNPKTIGDILPANSFSIAPEAETLSESQAGIHTFKDESSNFEASQSIKMDQELVPSTSQPEREALPMDVELQNEGQDEGFKGFESIDDIEIDDEQMLQIVNVISLCQQEDIINANQSHIDDIINADQSQLEDIITEQCQLEDINITITEEQFNLDDSMTENHCMEVQEDLKSSNPLNEITTFGQQKNNVTENQLTDISPNMLNKQIEQTTQEMHLFCQQGDNVTEDQRLMVAEANLRYGIPTVEYEVDHEESPVVQQPYLCTECRQRFSEHDELEQHLWDHIAEMTGKHPNKCSKCPGRTFSDMKEHKRHHRMGLECDVCGEAFHAAIVLADHRMRAHTRSKVYTCKVCKMTFSNRADLTQHKERHSKSKVFHCKMCSDSFLSEVGLSVHMKSHSGSSKIRNFIREKESPSGSFESKSHSCSQCGQDFISIEILDNHIKSEHSEVQESNFCCDICQKCFLKFDELKTHKTTHSDHKLYKCEECEASFSQKHILKEHSQKHRDKRKCQVCGYISSSSSRLTKHMKRNHRDKIFECKHCTKWFSTRDELLSHRDKEHKNTLRKEKSSSHDQSKHDLKDQKNDPVKEIIDEDSRCESSCATELSLEDHERSSSPEEYSSEEKRGSKSPNRDRVLESPSSFSEAKNKTVGQNETHLLEPLKKKLKEDSSSLESTKEKFIENPASLDPSNKQVHDDLKTKASEHSKIRSLEDSKIRSSDRSKGDKNLESESSKSKQRHSSKDGSKDDEKSSSSKVHLKGFKIPKLKKSKEAQNVSVSSEQSVAKTVEDKGSMLDRDLSDKLRDEIKSRWSEPVLEEKRTITQESSKSVPEEKRAAALESTKLPVNKTPLLATPPINKLPLLPTPVSNKIPLLATPRLMKKSRWGEPVKEDVATVWSGPSRVQSIETNKFVAGDSSIDRVVEDKKSWHDSSRDKSKQIRKSRWGEPLKDGEAVMYQSSNENSLGDNRLKANQPLVNLVEENKSTTNSLSPGQSVENNKFRLNQTLPPPVSNLSASTAILPGQTIASSRLKPNQVSTGKLIEESRHKPSSVPVERPSEESRFKSNPPPCVRPSEDYKSKSNPVLTGRSKEDAMFKLDSGHSGKPIEDNRSKLNPVTVGRPVEETKLKSNGIPSERPTEVDVYQLHPMPVAKPLVNKIKLNLLPCVKSEDNRLKPNWSSASNHAEENRFSSVGLTPKEQLELEYKKFEMLVQSSTENAVTNTELEYKKFEMLIQSSIGKTVPDGKSILYNPAKEKAKDSKKTRWGENLDKQMGIDSTLTSYKSLIGPVSENNKQVVDEPFQDDNRSTYSSSPMDMSIVNDDSSNDKSVGDVKENQEDEGLTWGASFLEENKLIWGKSFLEDQTSMLHEPLKEKAKEIDKSVLNKLSKNVAAKSEWSKPSTEALSSKSSKDKAEDQSKSKGKTPVDEASSVCQDSPKEDPAEWLDPQNVKPLEDPSLYYNPSKEEDMEEYSSSPENSPERNEPIWASSSSSDRVGVGYQPFQPGQWGESSTSKSSATTMMYGEQHFPVDNPPSTDSTTVLRVKSKEHTVSNSVLVHNKSLKGSFGPNSSQTEEDSEENKGSNLSELLEEWLKGNKPDEPVKPQTLERTKDLVPPGRMSNNNSDIMEFGKSLNQQPSEVPAGDDRKSNLSDLLESWLNEHKK